jgi:hypothetical protein
VRRRQRPAEVALLLGVDARRGAAGGGRRRACRGVRTVVGALGHWRYGSAWVVSATALYVLVLLLGGLGGRRPKEARLLATRLAGEDGPVSGELRALLDDRVSRVENYGSLLLVLVIVELMVFKP